MSKMISFIIPVYNVKEYINECVDSILNQITSSCEIILIDDGSTDGSGYICDEYAIKDFRVIVIHQENRGLASARNTGLEHANGDYIAFVDSDDYIADNCIDPILKWISRGGTDICFMKAIKVFPNGKQQLLDDEMDSHCLKENKENTIRYLSKRSKYPGSPCTKLIKRSLIENNNFRFPDDRRISEDLGFVLRCILNAESYDTLLIDYYYYRQARSGSITNNVTYKSFLGLKAFIEESISILTENKKTKGNIEKYAMSFIAYEFSIMIWQYKLIETKNKEEAMRFLKKYKWVLKYSASNKTRFIKMVCDFFGMTLCAELLDFYMKHRD